MKLKQKTISITLSIISMVIIAMCTVLPIFSFWNYRLCMIPFALISILLFFTNIKERSKKVYILFACLVFLLSIIAFLLASGMEGVVISSVLSVYIAILLLLPNTNRGPIGVTCVFGIIAVIIQISTICRWFDNYDLIISGAYPEIPLDMADRMLIAGFNEIGMSIIICCLICSAFSIQCNIPPKSESIESIEKVLSAESVEEKVEETIKNYDICIFDTTTHTLRKEKRNIDVTKFPPSKFADNDTYYAIETYRDGKKVRIYHTKDNWNKQIEIGISEEEK